MEDALEERVQETADHLLSNAVGDCGNAQRACFPCVSFGDVDASERLGLIGPVFQTSFERDQVLDELGLIQRDGDAIDARGSAVAFDAPEAVPEGKQVDTTCQRMSFDLGQSDPFQQEPMERRTGRLSIARVRGECFLTAPLSPGRPDDPDAGPF
jgi:hypothetical protein